MSNNMPKEIWVNSNNRWACQSFACGRNGTPSTKNILPRTKYIHHLEYEQVLGFACNLASRFYTIEYETNKLNKKIKEQIARSLKGLE